MQNNHVISSWGKDNWLDYISNNGSAAIKKHYNKNTCYFLFLVCQDDYPLDSYIGGTNNCREWPTKKNAI
jgi:hypothetical protein